MLWLVFCVHLKFSCIYVYKGNSCVKVSFCVPGPCGLVVLNSLRASRDLKSANPAGGLLPTPVLDPKVSTSYPAVYQNKPSKGKQKIFATLACMCTC